MADISSITLPGGGTYDLKDKNAIPKYGMGKNLLDNWYFLNAVNQRNISTVVATNSNVYTLDRWNAYRIILAYGIGNPLVFYASNSGTPTGYVHQWIEEDIVGKQVTASALLQEGTLLTVSGLLSEDTTLTSNNVSNVEIWVRKISGSNAEFFIWSRALNAQAKVVAVKLELGIEQTLAHQENSTWVLNEIPDYEEELIKCQTSTADPADIYANKSLATEQQLAYVETGTTASRNYTAGEYICWNGLTYTADSNIATGATLSASGGNKNLTECVGGGLNSNSIHRAVIPLYNAQTLFTLARGFGIAKVYGGNNGTTAVLTRTEQGSTKTRTVSVGASSWENIPVVAGDTITYSGGPYSNAEIYYITHHIGP